MHRVPQEGVFVHRVPLKTHSVPQEAVLRTRISAPYQRRGFPVPNITPVPEKPVFYTECFRKCIAYHRRPVLRTARIFRTTGGPLRYRMCRMPQMPGKRSLFLYSPTGKFNTNAKEKVSSPDGTTSKCPPANSPQLQSRGSREIFIPAAVLPRTDLTVF